jgi:hypothetical protein
MWRVVVASGANHRQDGRDATTRRAEHQRRRTIVTHEAPGGSLTSSTLPGPTFAWNQFDTLPRATRFTVTTGSPRDSGALDSE